MLDFRTLWSTYLQVTRQCSVDRSHRVRYRQVKSGGPNVTVVCKTPLHVAKDSLVFSWNELVKLSCARSAPFAYSRTYNLTKRLRLSRQASVPLHLRLRLSVTSSGWTNQGPGRSELFSRVDVGALIRSYPMLGTAQRGPGD